MNFLQETFDPAHLSRATMCDLEVTHDHVMAKYRTLKKEAFCLEAKHIECFKNKPAPRNLIIEQEWSKKAYKRKHEGMCTQFYLFIYNLNEKKYCFPCPVLLFCIISRFIKFSSFNVKE